MPAVIVYLVRHGETNENRLGIMQGQLDTALNAAGLEQARLAASALEKVPFVAAHSSDLSRAVKTAETILEKHRGVALQKHEALRERFMGDWQGKNISTWKGPSTNLEPATMFLTRADQWWKDVILRCVEVPTQHDGEAEEPERILVVSHGGLMHVLVQNLIESGKVKVGRDVEVGRYRFPNASITVIEVERSKKGTLVSFADTMHLDVEFVEGNADDLDE